MKLANGILLDSKKIEPPKSALSMAKRSMNESDFAHYAAVQMYEITYSSDGLLIKGFLALPPASEEKLPCIIFNRGGAGLRGALTPETLFGSAALYASWGYVTFASQYRGQGGSEGTEEWGNGDVNDVMNLLPLIRSLPYIDQDRLGLIGGSRGGMMALMILRQLSLFRAAVTIGAPTAFHLDDPSSHIHSTFGKFLRPDMDFTTEALRRSAAAWAHPLPDTTPLLVIHGSGDKRVAPLHAYHLGMALQKAHKPYKLIMYDNADHVLAGRRIESNRDIRWWIDHYVKNKAALPKVGPHGN